MLEVDVQIACKIVDLKQSPVVRWRGPCLRERMNGEAASKPVNLMASSNSRSYGLCYKPMRGERRLEATTITYQGTLVTKKPKSTSKSKPNAALKTRRFEGMRTAILDAAARQFNEHGVKGAALIDIAAAVGLVTSGITYYFQKKEDLAAACLLTSIAETKALVGQALEAPNVPKRVERFFSLLAELFASIERGERPTLISFSDTRSLPDALASTIFSAYVDLFRSVRTLLKGVDAPELSHDALNARTHLLLSIANNFSGWSERCEPSQYARLAERVSDAVLHGIVDPSFTSSDPDTLVLLEPAAASDETSESFLRAATELVNEQGYRGASVDKISALLNATKGKFYYYNETKFDLVTDCFERSFEVQRHFLSQAERTKGTSNTKIAAVTTSLIRFQMSDRGPLLRGSGFSALPGQEQRLRVFRSMERVIERMANLFIDGFLDSSVRAQDPTISASTLYSAINAASELRNWVPGLTPDDVDRLYVRPSLLGLLCDE